MEWLQSSLSGHKPVSKDCDESSFRKRYGNSTKKSSDPNKSETPLLFESPHCAENFDSDCKPPTGEKIGASQNITNKASFLNCSIFDKGSFKGKFQSDRQNSSGINNTAKENKKLLNLSENRNELISDDDNDESDEELCLPYSGRYQKVRSGAY